MTDIELNEEVLMELMGLPRWLRINSAVCANVSVKVHIVDCIHSIC